LIGEQFLHDGDVCNLGSLNLEKFVKNGTIDYPRLQAVTKLAVQMLDNVIDVTDFPVERVSTTIRRNRRVGLGIMGFADMLYLLKRGYHTTLGRQTAEEVMACIQQAAHEASSELAAIKGSFPNYDLSIYPEKSMPMRNAALTNIAPTGTTSMMFDVSGGVEPYFALAYHYRNILGGKTQLTYVNKHLQRALEEADLFSPSLMDEIIKVGSLQNIASIPSHIKEVFVTSMDITAEEHILMQAAFQKHVDNAISKTINFPHAATRTNVLEGYVCAWKNGCKGCTVYRNGSRLDQVLNLNSDESETAAVKEQEQEQAQKTEAEAETEKDPSLLTFMTTTVGAKRVKEGEMDEEVLMSSQCSATSVPSGLGAKKARRVSSAKHTGICPRCDQPGVPSEGCFYCPSCDYSVCAI
jgi:ribonucleoside-diphosphate reductase alpha chain